MDNDKRFRGEAFSSAGELVAVTNGTWDEVVAWADRLLEEKKVSDIRIWRHHEVV